MEKLRFDCGCEFDVISKNPLRVNYIPKPAYINFECKRTWEMISAGNTKGVFQIESQLGKMLSKKLKPENMEHLSALISLMRPGCISGDTQVLVRIHKRKNTKRYSYKKISLEQLFKNKLYYNTIISFNEETGKYIDNKIKNIICTGIKPVYKILLSTINRKDLSSSYDIKCTDDHKLLTPSGWKELKELSIGDRFLVTKIHGGKLGKQTSNNIDGEKYFREICFKHYEKKCIFCDWNKGSLDVNHLDGNRKTNNTPENLNYFCPNHHREYSENSISKEQALEARKKYKLSQYDDFTWAEFRGKEYQGESVVFDIQMETPNHNFIAGNVVVHNCLEAMIEGKSITNHYIDRKNHAEEISYLHMGLKPILQDTYGCLIYQEQITNIAKELCGFSLVEAELLRKAIGKKKTDVMAQCKILFLNKAKEIGILSEKEAEEIFHWIEKSQRYLFNKSHSVSYAFNSYITAYTKAHFPRVFISSYLRYAKDKTAGKVHEEVKELVNNGRSMGVEISGPDLRQKNINVQLIDKTIFFGLSNIKRVGETMAQKLLRNIEGLDLNKMTWPEFYLKCTKGINSLSFENMIECGVFDFLGVSRNKMLFEFRQLAELTDKELNFIENRLTREHPDVEYYLEQLVNGGVGKGKACFTKPRQEKIASLLNVIKKPPYSLRDTPEWIAGVEEAKLGVNLSASKLDNNHSAKCANITCSEIAMGNKRDFMLLACEVKRIKETLIKKGASEGRTMAFLTVEDETGMLDSVVAFADVWEQNRALLVPGNTVMIGGDLPKDSLIIKNVYQI